MARNSENDLRGLISEIYLMLPNITNGREDWKDLKRITDKIGQKLEVLRSKLSGHSLFAHVMDISVTADNELYALFQRIAGFTEDMSEEGSLTDADRVQLTQVCEDLLEELSHASKDPPKTDYIEPKAHLQDLYGLNRESSWDEIIQDVEKSKDNVTRLMREVYRFRRGLQLACESLESYGAKYSRLEGLDCEERHSRDELSAIMFGMRKVISRMETPTEKTEEATQPSPEPLAKAPTSSIPSESLDKCSIYRLRVTMGRELEMEDDTIRKIELKGKPAMVEAINKSREARLQALMIEALEFLLVGNGSTGNSRTVAQTILNQIKLLRDIMGIHL